MLNLVYLELVCVLRCMFLDVKKPARWLAGGGDGRCGLMASPPVVPYTRTSDTLRSGLDRCPAYFSPSWTAFQAERGRDFSVIVDGISN